MAATTTTMTGWERTWPAKPEHVADARHAVVRFAESFGANERLDALRLAVSEACANVVMHAGSAAQDHTFTVAVRKPDAVVEVKVRDHGHGMRPRTDSPGAGLGLGIIAQLADELEVRVPPDGVGTEVHMKFHLTA